MSPQVPLQDTDANMPMDLQLQLQRQHHVFEQIAQGYIPDEESYLSRWSPRPSLPTGVRVELKNRELWEQFHAETTEMIITKSGRRMFPSIQVVVNGLNKHAYYYAIMEIVLASDRRHKYCGNGEGSDNEKKNEYKNNIRGWSFAGPAEPQPEFERRIFIHPDNPATGEFWMQNSISFSKLKLTNNVGDHRNNVVLTSMHKYSPKIWLIRCANATTLDDLFSYPASVFSFKETEFIAVTAYQNANITKLKIDHNPFAKGFRETGQSRYNKRKYHQIGRSDEEESNSDSSDSNPSANNLDDLAQKSAKRSNIENSDDYDDLKPSIPIAEDQKSSSTPVSTHECEVSSAFHRPWLDSPSRKKLSEPMIPMVPWVPPAPSLLPEVPELNWFRYDFDYYLPFIAQQNLMRHQYYHPRYHGRKL